MTRPILSLIALLAICVTFAHAQIPQVRWAHALSGTGSVSAGCILADNQNIYVAGSFNGTVDFDPGTGTVSLTADTTFDKGTYFLARFNSLGDLLFVRQMSVSPGIMRLDNSGNICIAGEFRGTEDFDPGPGVSTLSSAGGADMFVAHYDATGAYLSAFRIGNANSEELNDIATDAAGNMFVTGNFRGTVDFDPGSGTTNLTSNGNEDVYLAKYSPAGSLLYAFRLNGTTSSTLLETGVSLAVDATGNYYLGGRFVGTIDLDPGSGTASFSSNGVDGFVAKFDAAGNYLSGFAFDGNVYAVALDGSGNFWVTGTMPDSMDADPGPGRAMLYSTAMFDIYLAKYDASCNYLHARAFQSNSTYVPEGLTIDAAGNAYIYGRFPDTVDFNPGGAGGRLISAGGQDAFITKYNPAGAFLEAFSIGGSGDDRGLGLTADGTGGFWASGYFNGSADVDPGPSATNLSAGPNTSGFLVRYGSLIPFGVHSSTLSPVGVFGGRQSVLIDFSALDVVDAQVTVLSLSGQTVAQARHNKSDRLRMELPDGPPQMYIVRISNGGTVKGYKVWVD